MTVIAYKDGIMVADSGTWSEGIVYEVPFPKLTRSPSGCVLGLAGKLSDAWLLRQWVLGDMPKDHKPEFSGKDQEEPAVLMARPDGSLWRSGGALRFCPEPLPSCAGEITAASFVEGAMAAGASAEEAVRLAIQHNCWAAGTPQVVVVGTLGATEANDERKRREKADCDGRA
jgi:hypothetical protein